MYQTEGTTVLQMAKHKSQEDIEEYQDVKKLVTREWNGKCRYIEQYIWRTRNFESEYECRQHFKLRIAIK